MENKKTYVRLKMEITEFKTSDGTDMTQGVVIGSSGMRYSYVEPDPTTGTGNG